MEDYGLTIIVGLTVGMLARLLMLRSDYRHFPGYPHGYVTHISLGFVAAALGAVAVPALVEKEYTAVTFLALAAQQFREIRNMERETLNHLEEIELVPRGKDLVEGIARVFESRNYLVIAASLQASVLTYFAGLPWAVLSSGIVLWIFSNYLAKGKVLREIADVVPSQPYFGFAGYKTLLMVDEVVIMEVGLESARKKIMEEGLGVLIKPKDDNARATLHQVGQRQAILHTVSNLIGTKKEVGEPEWSPIARKNIDTGEVALFILPNEPDIRPLIQAVNITPVLESSRTTPLESKPGKLAQD
ncbi:MAG: hypothetical protein GX318_05230 [Clostridia bacterium]|nr:hypothetical protein [Clostridia bacterium]